MIVAVALATAVAGGIALRFIFPLPAVFLAVLLATLTAAYFAAH